MTSGTVTFTVDGVECPDTNGVGVDAIGGIFNCGITGTTFRVECTTKCAPMFRIVELMLWSDKVQTIDGMGTPYYLPGGSACSILRDVDKAFSTGSYWYAARSVYNIFCADRGSGVGDKANVAYTFSTPKVITRVIQLGMDSEGPYRIQLGATTFAHPLTDSDSTLIYNSDDTGLVKYI